MLLAVKYKYNIAYQSHFFVKETWICVHKPFFFRFDSILKTILFIHSESHQKHPKNYLFILCSINILLNLQSVENVFLKISSVQFIKCKWPLMKCQQLFPIFKIQVFSFENQVRPQMRNLNYWTIHSHTTNIRTHKSKLNANARMDASK